jgi:hypothetical protein
MTQQSLLLDVPNGKTPKRVSTWKALKLQQLLRLPSVQKSDSTLQENRRLTTETRNLHSISHIHSTSQANRVVHNSSLQEQTMDILVLLRIQHKGAIMVPPLSAAGSRTPVKATIKATLLLDQERWISLQANLGR